MALFLNIYCFLDGSAPIEIGEGVQFGPYVKIFIGNAYANSVLRRGPFENLARAVRIERGCWWDELIMPGVTVAEGCDRRV